MFGVKNLIVQLLSFLPLGVFFKTRYGGKGTILFMHKVVEQKRKSARIALMEANEIESSFLDKMIRYFKKKNYDIISLDEMTKRLKTPANNNRKFVVFTFDDGYKDNLTLAYPIFAKHQVPFTIYLTNCFPNKTAQLWWYMLEDIVLENDAISAQLKGQEHTLTSTTNKEKETAFGALRDAFIAMSFEQQQRDITAFGTTYGKQLHDYVEREALNWDEIKGLSEDPLVTIAGHTMNHVTLNALSPEMAVAEMVDSKNEIEHKTQSKVLHFAYPFGTPNEINAPEVRLTEESKAFHTATTTRMGNIFEEHKDALHALPRIQVLGNQQNLRVLKLYLNGFLPAIKNGFKRVITI